MSDEIENRLRVARLELEPPGRETEERALLAALAALPELHARARPANRNGLRRLRRALGPRRRRRLVLLAATALPVIVIGVVVWTLVSTGSSSSSSVVAAPDTRDLRHVELPPLPPGPKKVAGGLGVALVEGVSLAEMIERSDAVFVGEVVAIGGPEAIEPAPVEPGVPPIEVYRVRYSITRVLRGERVDTIDVTGFGVQPSALDGAFSAEVGRRYLVFTEWRELGSTRTPRLVPTGYSQGVYELVSPTQAVNEGNGTVNLEDVAARVEEASP